MVRLPHPVWFVLDRVSLNVALTVSAGRARHQGPWDLSPVLEFQACDSTPSFYAGAGDLNSGLHLTQRAISLGSLEFPTTNMH